MSEAPVVQRMNAQQRIATDPDATIWVTASAGTGKTRVLANRIARLLLDGCQPHRILALTYTNAAAAEMAQRVHETLRDWAVCDERKLSLILNDLTGQVPDMALMARARRCFAQMLASPIGLRAHTIHGFCQSLLRRFPIEAGIAPHFTLIDDRTADEMLVQARATVLGRTGDNPEGFGWDAARTLAEFADETRVLDLVQDILREPERLRALPNGRQAIHADLCDLLGADPMQTEQSIIEATCAFEAEGLRRAADVMARNARGFRKDWGLKMLRWLGADMQERIQMFRHYAQLGASPEGMITSKMTDEWPDIADVTTPEWHRVTKAIEQANRAALVRVSTALILFAKAVGAEYERLKSLSGYLDYGDLIEKATALLSQSSARAWVLYKLDGGLDHILVDEAQDNSRAQWSIFASLAEEMIAGEGGLDRQRSLFVVGDPKQSIYRFQGAAPDAFDLTRQWLTDQLSSGAAERELKRVTLNESYRCAAPILEFVDAVLCDGAMPPGAFPADAAEVGHKAHEPDSKPGLVEIWPLIDSQKTETSDPWPLPDRYDTGERADYRLAAGVAEKIADLTRHPTHAVAPGDILVLVRNRGNFAGSLIRELKNRDVAVEGADRLKLAEDLAVRDLLVLGEFLLQRDDDLALATVLRGPLIGLGEEQLFALAYGRSETLWRRLAAAAGDHEAFNSAHAYLHELLAGVDYSGPHAFLEAILSTPCPADAVSGRRALIARLGRPVNDPVDELLSQALTYERLHAPSIQGFLSWLQGGDEPVKRDSSESGGGVRVMTIHGAKGLEANTVILADIDSRGGGKQGLVWMQRHGGGPSFPIWPPSEKLTCKPVSAEAEANKAAERAESMRLLYVALTRAEQRLYICGTGELASGGKRRWIDYCHDAMGGLKAVQRRAFASSAVEDWEGEAFSYLRRDELFARAVAANDDATEVPLPDWLHRPAPRAEARRLVRPSRWEAEGAEPASISPVSRDGQERFRRGLLIHTLLERLPAVPVERREDAARSWLRRPVHGLSDEQVEDYLREALAVIGNPEFGAIFSDRALPEVPVVGQVGDLVINGQIDRMVETPEEILIVDFKTNRPPPATVEGTAPIYLRQMAGYRAVLRQIYPGKSVRCGLLWTAEPRFMALPDALLAKVLTDSRS